MRPRSDQVHLAAEHVDQLRQFVEAEAAQVMTDARDAIDVVGHPLGPRFSARMHRPELQEAERPAVAAGALLDEEHRSARVELDRDGDRASSGAQSSRPAPRRRR
jgi:hypothetical protein